MDNPEEGKSANWLRSQPVHRLMLYGSALSFLIAVVIGNATRLDMVALGLLLWVGSQITGE